MAKRKQDQSPIILKFFRLANPKENEGSSGEGVNSAESETRPTLKTAVIDVGEGALVRRCTSPKVH